MGTVFQIGETGIEAINGVELARTPEDTLTIEAGGIADVQNIPQTQDTQQQTRTFSFGTNGLEAMLTDDGITDLKTNDGQVAVVSGSDVNIADVPGYSGESAPPQFIDPTAPTFS